MSHDVVIAGGGLAAVRTAQGLRDRGFTGSVLLVSDEARAPYDRPPLSKDYLLGTVDDDAITLLGPAKQADLGVELRLGDRAVSLDGAGHVLHLASGEAVRYGQLVIATGAQPNRLPLLEDVDGVVYLRTADDAQALRAQLAGRPRVGIVGGGFIGLEIAAVATQLGCDVTVVEVAPAPLSAVLGEALGRFVQSWHEEQGVRFRCSAAVAQVQQVDGRVRELVLDDGTALPVDVVVVGVGVRPTIDWLRDSGLELHHGVVCDADGRTSDPAVFAVGDVACRHAEGACRPSGHWTAATEQASAAAAAIAGATGRRGFEQEGYFWSDQFGARLQFAGRVTAEPLLTLSSGELEARKFVALLGDGDAVTGIFAMNSPREFMKTSLTLGR